MSKGETGALPWHERLNRYGEAHGLLERASDGEYVLTNKATARQDAVDSAIVELANRLVPFGMPGLPDEPETMNGEQEQELEYDGQWVGDMRDAAMVAVFDGLVHAGHSLDRDEFEMQFYPYVAADGGAPGEASSVQSANVIVCLSDPMHERHRPELARNILNALVREAQSNVLAPEGAEGDEDTGGYTQRIRVFVGDALAEEDLARP